MSDNHDPFFSNNESEDKVVEEAAKGFTAPEPTAGYVGGHAKEDSRIVDPLNAVMSEAAFGHGSYRDDTTPVIGKLTELVTESVKAMDKVAGITHKVIPLDTRSFQHPIAAMITEIKNVNTKLMFLFVIRSDDTGIVPINQLQQALDNKQLWPEDLLSNPDILEYLLQRASQKLLCPMNDIDITGGLVVPKDSITRNHDEIARISTYSNIFHVVKNNPERKAALVASISELVKLNPLLRRQMIRIGNVPDALDYTPATWAVSVIANRPGTAIQTHGRKNELDVYGYTDVTPGMLPTANGMQAFGFVPTYIITDIKHDTKLPVEDRTLFALAALTEAAAAQWYRQSLVPHGTESINNIWALRPFVDPEHQFEKGEVPSIEPPQNEMARNMEMDMLIHPQIFSVVADFRVGDQKSWFCDTMLGLASGNAQVQAAAEAEVLRAADNLTNGAFSQKWANVPKTGRIADYNIIPTGIVHLKNGEVQDERTITTLTYANILASSIENGYDLQQLRSRLMLWSDYSNADLRGDRNNMRQWIQTMESIDPEIGITGWTYRVSFNMSFLITLLQAMAENGYRPVLEGSENVGTAPNSLRGSIINHAGALPPELMPHQGGYGGSYAPYGMPYGYTPTVQGFGGFGYTQQ